MFDLGLRSVHIGEMLYTNNIKVRKQASPTDIYERDNSLVELGIELGSLDYLPLELDNQTSDFREMVIYFFPFRLRH